MAPGRVSKVRVDTTAVARGDPERVLGFCRLLCYMCISVRMCMYVYHFGADGKTLHGSQGRNGWRGMSGDKNVRQVEDQLCE